MANSARAGEVRVQEREDVVGASDWQLNQADEAKAALITLEAPCMDYAWMDNRNAQAFLKEARELITATP